MAMEKRKPTAKNTAARRTQKRPTVAEFVQRLYNKSAPLLICEALLFGAGAVLLILKPVAVLTMLTVIIGVGLILVGLYQTIAGFVVSRNIGGGWLDVFLGVINVVLGVLFCVYPSGALVSMVYIFVILFLFNALRSLIFAINMWRARFGHYIFNFIMAVVLVAGAVALLFFPLAGALVGAYYLAAGLLIYAAADVYMYAQLRQLKQRLGQN